MSQQTNPTWRAKHIAGVYLGPVYGPEIAAEADRLGISVSALMQRVWRVAREHRPLGSCTHHSTHRT
jgi:hypothetical protein